MHKFCLSVVIAVVGFCSSAIAQERDQISVEINLDIGHLTKNTEAVVLYCEVISLFEPPTTVGKGLVFLYHEDWQELEEQLAANPDLIENVEFLAYGDVFGEGGSRELDTTIVVSIYEAVNYTQNVNLETWQTGYCELSVLGTRAINQLLSTQGSDILALTPEDFIGELPVDCAGSAAVEAYQCIRPGSRIVTSFEFEREFGGSEVDN